MATFWGMDLAVSKVAIARLPLPETGVLYVKAPKVPLEQHEERIAKACWLAGCVDEALKDAGPSDILAIESSSASGRSHAVSVGEVFGLVLRVVISHLAGRWMLVNPIHLKMFPTNDHRATGAKMAAAAQRLWGFEGQQNGDAYEDELDAFCLAQIARCVAEPEEFTAYQREIVQRCFITTGKKPVRKNLQCEVRAE